ncbi:outer membrane protein assembly factor BamB family protein [Halopenitus persicus]|uniref:Outer membrane protein assembly factor BamB, contains PQQ-like beta-propeller repeat n=1 Tax=Halopenitus persicus TaxID=1048396 RepID=A0A1H3JX42_9EURY|nr:PQQ-binding-like beta-propeller repeat protein [Halopenitus persicus]SDY43834.1 Outer membrane protein assembly factor BamB, contains PQQ-like beta-propeller repeat [Halopenitus persicus]
MRRRALLLGSAAGIAASATGCLGRVGAPEAVDGTATDDLDDDAGDDPDDPTGDWTQFQADAAHTGATAAAGPDGGGRVRWWSDTWGLPTGPVITDGRVYVGSGLRNQSVFAFERATGDRLWRAPIGDDVERALAVDDGTVYASASGVYALDAGTGETEWTERVDASWGLAVADGAVVAASGGGGPILSLDASTGEERWTREIHTITTPSVADERVFAVGNDDLIALDAGTGETEWTESIDRAGGAPTVADGTVVVGTREDLFAHDAATGDREWTLEGSFRGTDVATSDGTIYLAGRQREDDEWLSRALAVDAATGDVLWTRDDDGLGAGSVVVADGIVYVATRHRVYAIDRATGDVEWWLRFQWPVGSPAVSDGTLYVTVGGRLLAIGSGTGRAGVWPFDAEPVPDRDAAPPEPSYVGSDFPFGLAGFDVRSDWDVAVDEGAPIDVSFVIDGDRVDDDETVTLTLAVTNEGDETLRFTTGAPTPFGILRLRGTENRIVPWTPSYEDSGHVHTAPHLGITGVNAVALSAELPPGETMRETYTISEETHGIRPDTYDFSIAQTLSTGDVGGDGDGWEFEVTGTVELTADEPESGDVVHDLVVADEVDLPTTFLGRFTVDVLEPVTTTHPGLIEVTFENVTDERSLVTSLRRWPLGSVLGLGPDGRRLVLLPASTYAPGFVTRTDDGWWEPTLLPHESVVRGRSTTAYDPGETTTERFIVTTHPGTDAPRNGDGYAFEQGFGDDDVDVTWGFTLSTLDPDG